MVNAALAELGPDFEAIYSLDGRPSIAPEKLLRAWLLQILYSIRSERLLDPDVARGFFEAIVSQARDEGLTSDELFSVERIPAVLHGPCADGQLPRPGGGCARHTSRGHRQARQRLGDGR